MLTVLKTALEVGLIYGLVALALFISFSILNIADLSTDGCFTLGCAVGAMLTIAGHPLLALPGGHGRGCALGLHHRLFADAPRRGEHPRRHHLEHRPVHDQPRGHGLFVQRVHHGARYGLFAVQGTHRRAASGAALVLLALLLGVIAVVLIRFFGTSLGLSIRATGDSLDMVSASSINPKVTITIGLVPRQRPHGALRLPDR